MAHLPASYFSMASPCLGFPLDVLIASPMVNPGLGFSLSSVNCALHQARSMEEAVSLMGKLQPAVVITDETLPGGDWRAILTVARTLAEPPEVIVASRNTWLLAEVTMEGGMDVLLKPYTVPFAVEMTLIACQRWFRGRDFQPAGRSGIAERAMAS